MANEHLIAVPASDIANWDRICRTIANNSPFPFQSGRLRFEGPKGRFHILQLNPVQTSTERDDHKRSVLGNLEHGHEIESGSLVLATNPPIGMLEGWGAYRPASFEFSTTMQEKLVRLNSGTWLPYDRRLAPHGNILVNFFESLRS